MFSNVKVGMCFLNMLCTNIDIRESSISNFRWKIIFVLNSVKWTFLVMEKTPSMFSQALYFKSFLCMQFGAPFTQHPLVHQLGDKSIQVIFELTYIRDVFFSFPYFAMPLNLKPKHLLTPKHLCHPLFLFYFHFFSFSFITMLLQQPPLPLSLNKEL